MLVPNWMKTGNIGECNLPVHLTEDEIYVGNAWFWRSVESREVILQQIKGMIDKIRSIAPPADTTIASLIGRTLWYPLISPTEVRLELILYVSGFRVGPNIFPPKLHRSYSLHLRRTFLHPRPTATRALQVCPHRNLTAGRLTPRLVLTTKIEVCPRSLLKISFLPITTVIRNQSNCSFSVLCISPPPWSFMQYSRFILLRVRRTQQMLR